MTDNKHPDILTLPATVESVELRQYAAGGVSAFVNRQQVDLSYALAVMNAAKQVHMAPSLYEQTAIRLAQLATEERGPVHVYGAEDALKAMLVLIVETLGHSQDIRVRDVITYGSSRSRYVHDKVADPSTYSRLELLLMEAVARAGHGPHAHLLTTFGQLLTDLEEFAKKQENDPK